MSYMVDRKEQIGVVGTFRKALRCGMHNLLERSEILWQQIYSRLQWADGDDKDGPVAKVIAPEFEKRTTPGAGPWLHNKCRFRESEALIAVFEGHTDTVNFCAFSPDGQNLASAGFDRTVRLWDVATGIERKVLARPLQFGHVLRLQPGRSDPGLGQLGRNGTVLGCSHRQAYPYIPLYC